jgi:ketosteroid isomerase-like protein
VTDQRAVVDRYLDGFRASDHAAVLACLTDDVVWRIHGHRTTHGAAEFDTEIEGADFEGSPLLTVDRTYEDGNVVIVTGEGQGTHREHGPFRFAFSDLFTFRDGRIAAVDSYVVPLGEP